MKTRAALVAARRPAPARWGRGASAGTTRAQADLHAGRETRRRPGAPAAAGLLRPGGPPVAGEPAPVNMAYFGGHVQVTPKIYLVFWGWGEPGAFDHTTPGMPAERPGRRGRSA